MRKSIFHRALAFLLCMLLLPTNTPSRASTNLNTQANEIAGGIAAVGAAIVVVAVILVVHYKPASVKGCVASGPNGLELKNGGDQLTYALTGDTSQVKPGEVVKVQGKKKSGKHGASPSIEVKHFEKDYGACPAAQ